MARKAKGLSRERYAEIQQRVVDTRAAITSIAAECVAAHRLRKNYSLVVAKASLALESLGFALARDAHLHVGMTCSAHTGPVAVAEAALEEAEFQHQMERDGMVDEVNAKKRGLSRKRYAEIQLQLARMDDELFAVANELAREHRGGSRYSALVMAFHRALVKISLAVENESADYLGERLCVMMQDADALERLLLKIEADGGGDVEPRTPAAKFKSKPIAQRKAGGCDVYPGTFRVR